MDTADLSILILQYLNKSINSLPKKASREEMIEGCIKIMVQVNGLFDRAGVKRDEYGEIGHKLYFNTVINALMNTYDLSMHESLDILGASLTTSEKVDVLSKEDKPVNIKDLIVNKLQRIIDIFKPKYKHIDPNVRLKALKQISREYILAGIVKTDLDSKVSAAAVDKIISEDLLFDIVVSQANDIAKDLALRKISDENILVRIALECKDWVLRMGAVTRITLVPSLIDIIKNEKEKEVYEVAISQINDENILCSLVIDDQINSADVRIACLKRISDEKLMYNLLGKTVHEKIRLAIIKKIEDKEILNEVACSEISPLIREAAAKKVIQNDSRIRKLGDSGR